MSEVISAKDLRSGHTILRNNNIYLVLDNSFNKTAMREGIVKCKVKNLRTGSITIEVLTGEKLQSANVDHHVLTYSYNDGTSFIFMNSDTFEQVEIANKKLDWEKNFIVEESQVKVISYEGEVLGVELPDQVSIKVEYAEEGVQGNTATTALKKATLVTGWVLDVPQFIKTNEKIIVRTIDGSYVSRG
jgi:elongation factor P